MPPAYLGIELSRRNEKTYHSSGRSNRKGNRRSSHDHSIQPSLPKALVVQDGRRRRSITPEAKGDRHAVGPGVVEVGKELMTRGNAGREAHETPGKETTAELEIVQRKYSIVRVRNIATVVIIADREFVIVVRVSTREGVVPVTNNAEGTTAGAGHARGKG